jgi:glycosyltransferase involved in cell wall biosynthesis
MTHDETSRFHERRSDLMNVLLISPEPFFSERGTPIAVRQLAQTLCADGHRVDLLTYPFGENVEMEGLTIHRCGRFPGVRRVGIGFSVAKLLLDVMLVMKLWGMARRGRYDAVHAVEESVYPALMLRWRHRAKVIYDMDSSLAEQLADTRAVFRLLLPVLRRIEGWAIRSSDEVAPVCYDLARYVSAARANGDLVVLHDVPVSGEDDPDPMNELPAAGSAAACLALYVGNLESYQGIDLLVDAAALLPEDSPVRVVVVGGPSEEAERYRAISARRGLDGRLLFVGPRPLAQLKSLLAQADVLLSPRSQGRNTPLKLYSYMDSGRAILATRLSTHTQVLDDSTALLVEPNAGDIARGLLRLVEDEELRRRLAAAAKRRVAQGYSLVSFNDRVRDLYSRRTQIGTGPANGTRTGGEPACRRSASDRRSEGDRRTTPRNAADRRVAERRAFAYA